MSYFCKGGVAVDATYQIVFACTVHGSASVQGMLQPVLDATIEDAGGAQDHCLADAGFSKPEHASIAEDLGIVPLIAQSRGERDNEPKVFEGLSYDVKRGKLRCSGGNLVPEAEPTETR